MSHIHIAPHLQRALDTMSKDLSIDPQALVNQALFAWLRINGYVLPGAAGQVTTNPELAAVPPAASDASLPIPPHVSRASPVPLGSIPAPATGSMPAQRAEPPPPAPVVPVVAPVVPPVAPPPVAPVAAAAPAPAAVPAPVAAAVSAPSAAPAEGPHVLRMKEITADLAKFTQDWPDWVVDAPLPEPDDEDEDEPEDDDADEPRDEDEPDEEEQPSDDTPEPGAPRAEAQDEASPDDDEDLPDEEEEEQPAAAAAGPVPQVAGDDPFEATSIRSSVREEGLDENTGENQVDEPAEEDDGPPPESTVVLRSVPIVLYLEREGEDPIRIENERFIIGRGPTCDLIIDSPRVSREHVVLTREGIRYFIEDLNSSNGTWLGEERITKREIESGDLISLGNEPVTFILRGE